jgi:hypothetical protein
MDYLTTNPFAVLTFIVAPAVLTNASTVMGLQTSNRFARSIDRLRALVVLLEGKEEQDDPETRLRWRQVEYGERRTLMLVRALTAFYLAVGLFAATSFVSLVGATFYILKYEMLRDIFLAIALACGCVGIGGLLVGSATLVLETRQTHHILSLETSFLREQRLKRKSSLSSNNQPAVE